MLEVYQSWNPALSCMVLKNISALNYYMRPKRILYTLLATLALLLIPLVAMQLTSEVQWDLTDFMIMGALIFMTGLVYELIANNVRNSSRKLVMSIGLFVLFVYVWAELAIGIFNFPGISGS